LHVAAYAGQREAMRARARGGRECAQADLYDVVTIARWRRTATLKVALEISCRAGNVTSRYDGTALIAAAHLGHAEVVRTLILAGAPLDHVNNLGWTAVIEAIVLGEARAARRPRRAGQAGADEPRRPRRHAFASRSRAATWR
jgi:ankyrin repeat protein